MMSLDEKKNQQSRMVGDQDVPKRMGHWET